MIAVSPGIWVLNTDTAKRDIVAIRVDVLPNTKWLFDDLKQKTSLKPQISSGSKANACGVNVRRGCFLKIPLFLEFSNRPEQLLSIDSVALKSWWLMSIKITDCWGFVHEEKSRVWKWGSKENSLPLLKGSREWEMFSAVQGLLLLFRTAGMVLTGEGWEMLSSQDK